VTDRHAVKVTWSKAIMTARLLLVDDELHILKAAEFKLKRRGYHVDCAQDGQEAWEKVQANPPNLVVTDLQMPRMDGLQLIGQLRDDERFVDLPAILLTAKGFELDHDDIISRLGVFEIISKPFSPRELCKRVEAAFAQYENQGQNTDPQTGVRQAGFDDGQTGEDSLATADLDGASDMT
jgi:DNA-binding response OmpR family regulator